MYSKQIKDKTLSFPSFPALFNEENVDKWMDLEIVMYNTLVDVVEIPLQ